jgi:hypothetical protein
MRNLRCTMSLVVSVGAVYTGRSALRYVATRWAGRAPFMDWGLYNRFGSKIRQECAKKHFTRWGASWVSQFASSLCSLKAVNLVVQYILLWV